MTATTPFDRARSAEQRSARREAILRTAAEMLTRMRVAELSLNALAREVGLAKSNVLRYFESREAVLLELYDRETKAWLDALADRLVELPASLGGVERVAIAIADTAVARPVFCDLCASAPGVLERNVSATVAADYKRSAIANATRLAEEVVPLLGDLPFNSMIALVGGVNLIIGGTWTTSQPSPGIAAYAAHPELRAAQLHQRVAIRELVATLLTGCSTGLLSIDLSPAPLLGLSLSALAVGAQRQRDEDHQQHGHPAQRPDQIGGVRAAVHQRTDVDTRCEIGLTFTNACSQPGIVAVATKVLLPKLSGSTSRNPIPCTAPDVRATMPMKTEIQQKHRAKAMARPTAASADTQLVWTRKPISMPAPKVTTQSTT